MRVSISRLRISTVGIRRRASLASAITLWYVRMGRIEMGRSIERVGAHCKGHNGTSVGVCYVGGLSRDGQPQDTRTEEQRESMMMLIGVLKRMFPEAKVHGHREFAAKACPCFDAGEEYK